MGVLGRYKFLHQRSKYNLSHYQSKPKMYTRLIDKYKQSRPKSLFKRWKFQELWSREILYNFIGEKIGLELHFETFFAAHPVYIGWPRHPGHMDHAHPRIRVPAPDVCRPPNLPFSPCQLY